MAETNKILKLGDLAVGEPHPAAATAKRYLEQNFTHAELLMWLEGFCSCSIEGNRSAEICAATLRRLLNGEPVSDRYLLGLAWTMRDCKEAELTRS